MHSKTCFSIVALQISVLAVAAFMSPVQAAGFGKLTVFSAVGQPLLAEIELAPASINETGPLVARLASDDAYASANIELNPILSSLQFAIEQRGAVQLIHITSSKPIDEPFIDMLIELSWNNGRLQREYSFLLDAAVVNQSAQVRTAIVPGRDRNAKPVPAAAPAAVSAPGTQHEIKRGETLSQIALAVKPPDISLDLMLLALYRANPDAFIAHNINRLRSGQIMAIPAPDALRASSAGAASAARILVLAHAADFAAYRNRLAGQVALSTAEKALPSGQSAAGKVSATVTEPASKLSAAPDRLKLTTAAPSKAAAAAKTAGKNAPVEDAIAKNQQISDDQARIKELENNVGDLEQLMSVKIKTMLTAPVPPQTASASAPAKNVPPVGLPLFNQAWLTQLIQALTDNAIASAIAVLALLIGVVVALRRQPRVKAAPSALKQSAAPYLPDDADEADEAAIELFEPKSFASLEAQAGAAIRPAIVADVTVEPTSAALLEAPDPLAQAEVYLAYGRDGAAEEILMQALLKTPEQLAVRLKLLEMYAAHKHAELFEIQAGQLFSQTKGSGDVWVRAAALGRAIDPQNGLYALPAAVSSALQLASEPAAGTASIDFSARKDPERMTQEEALFDINFDLPFDPPHAHAHLLDRPAPVLAHVPAPVAAHVPMTAPELELAVIDPVIKPHQPVADAPQEAGQSGEQAIVLARQMDTKLDLASAYQEIGDKEGARELLDEVIDAGSAEQAAQARLRKRQLA